jgi:hypothetical protein
LAFGKFYFIALIPLSLHTGSTNQETASGRPARIALNMDNFSFIDLFSGCGGFSLGLSLAGLQGQFAIERDPMAFETFSANMLGNRPVPVRKFSWPEWLEQKAWSIDVDLHRKLTHFAG